MVKCLVCKRKIEGKEAVYYHSKAYCRRCYDRIPKEIVITSVNSLIDRNDGSVLI